MLYAYVNCWCLCLLVHSMCFLTYLFYSILRHIASIETVSSAKLPTDSMIWLKPWIKLLFGAKTAQPFPPRWDMKAYTNNNLSGPRPTVNRLSVFPLVT